MVLRTCGVAERAQDIDAIVAANLLHGKRFEGLFSTEGNVINGFPQILEQEIGASGGHSTEAVREAMVLGSPDEVAEQLEAYAALGVDEFCYGGNYGLDHARTRRSLELFVERVDAAVRVAPRGRRHACRRRSIPVGPAPGLPDARSRARREVSRLQSPRSISRAGYRKGR